MLTPSPGEVIDRITILDLKILAADKAEIDAVDFVAEKVSLEQYLSNWVVTLGDSWPQSEIKEQIDQKRNLMTALNSLIWEATDLVNDLPDTETARLAFTAKRVVKLNKVRAETVRELNILYGAGDGVEKIYGVSIGR